MRERNLTKLEKSRRTKSRRDFSFVGNLQQNISNKFGLAVKDRRKKLNLTQDELAQKAKLNRSYLSELERGKVSISLDRAEKLAQALNCSLRDLL